ncbi:MAG: VWA domain-containing protein [Deltaproteobacteria bacterium]|nr:VWA domain-containing protein [Deltaproteobacteria bacterium]
MRKTLAKFLLLALVTTSACGKHEAADTAAGSSAASAEHAGDLRQEPAMTAPIANGAMAGSGSAAVPPPPTYSASTDSAATGTAMALDEGKMGRKDREQAIAQYKSAGVLAPSSATVGPGGGGTGQGTIGTGRYGTIGHGAGTGQGYGVGGGRGGMVASNAIAAPDPTSSEDYKDYGQNAWTVAAQDHLSTFAADVDTASYTIMRRKLVEGALPPAAAVRVEELVNYFKYTYPAPEAGRPFSVTMDAAPSPFAKNRTIVRVGVASKPIGISERKPANLVFLVDVSGSMRSADKLDLAKRSLRILVDNLKDGDTVALVTYAGSTRVVLPATSLEHKEAILAAIEDLQAGGSTAMASGIDLAYDQAAKGLAGGATSRVLVLTDGDANVGRTSHEQILATIAGKVKEGVTLSTIGFGMGNYKDSLMEQLADKGNGNAFYIDGLSQAKRVFQEQLGSTLEVVAQDVKLQVDFNPELVSRYRLIGYENRNVADDDFRNDKVDAGEIGAGHQVTALYEIEWKDTITADKTPANVVPLVVRVRHKAPRGTTATEAVFKFDPANLASQFSAANDDMRFAFAVAAFGDVMRGGADARDWKLEEIRAIAHGAAGSDLDRAEFLKLVDRAIELKRGAGNLTAIAH